MALTDRERVPETTAIQRQVIVSETDKETRKNARVVQEWVENQVARRLLKLGNVHDYHVLGEIRSDLSETHLLFILCLGGHKGDISVFLSLLKRPLVN